MIVHNEVVISAMVKDKYCLSKIWVAYNRICLIESENLKILKICNFTFDFIYYPII